jgi:uncharacterized membrane protein (DUF2068 family)
MTASSSSKPTMIVVTAIWTIILAIFNICILGLPVIGLGALVGGAGSQLAQDANTAAGAEALQAASTVGGGLFAIIGIIFLVIGIALLVDAVGLFQAKPWSWMLTLILYGVYIVLTILSWLLNRSLNIVSLILVIIGAVIVYFFYTNADIKRALGKL